MHYVSGGGSSLDGQGAIYDPWNLYTLCNGAQIAPGDTVYLRAGTYSGNWNFGRNGESGNRITVKPYPGEHVEIDGYLTISGNYVDWIGMEHFDSDYTDRSVGADAVGVQLTGDYSRLVNCVLHDFPQGTTTTQATVGCEWVGCIIYHCGWDDNLGHGLYLQNAGPVQKRIAGCVVFDNFGYNLHLYGSSSQINDFLVEDNIAFNAGSPESSIHYYVNIFVGGHVPFNDPEVRNNASWFSPQEGKDGGAHIQIGYGSGNTVTNAVITGNWLGGGADGAAIDTASIKLISCVPATLSGNTAYGQHDGFTPGDYPDNTFGTTAADVPDTVKLYANETDSDRAHVAIFNAQALANAVAVDVSGVFANGDTITARNVQDYWNDTQSLTVSGGSITLNMQASNRTVATPQGWTAPATTFPAFGAFVLERAQ